MSITAKELIKLLQKCDSGAIVSVLDGEQSTLEFVEFCPRLNTIFLQLAIPDLVDTDSTRIEILEQEEYFAKTKYCDTKTGITW